MRMHKDAQKLRFIVFIFQASNLKGPIDDRIINHIKHLVNENITHPRENQRNVKMLVKSIFGSRLPSDLNRRFYPSREDIRKIVYRKRKRLMDGKLDQQLLAEKVEEWTGEDTGNLVFFRPRTEDGDKESSSFLLIFQSEWQRRLLAK
ncbi:hypothetical protein DPMN_058163 [Dreissena polymorpha]|uniref:Uncharacterized protein n=1 Tax=Dreissena polymorpha TaxID=45954 RepID=A0A9D4C1N4_DREPO|nr:hypothetical protein DPMN_058163 [Dreissena polymorpha]